MYIFAATSWGIFRKAFYWSSRWRSSRAFSRQVEQSVRGDSWTKQQAGVSLCLLASREHTEQCRRLTIYLCAELLCVKVCQLKPVMFFWYSIVFWKLYRGYYIPAQGYQFYLRLFGILVVWFQKRCPISFSSRPYESNGNISNISNTDDLSGNIAAKRHIISGLKLFKSFDHQFEIIWEQHDTVGPTAVGSRAWEINGNNMNNPYLDLFGRLFPQVG